MKYVEVEMRDIPGYEGKYAITPNGHVWSYKMKRFIAETDNGQGYLFVILYKNSKMKHFRTHRLVAEVYLEKPKGWNEDWVVDHINGNRQDNHYSNLSWITKKENLQKADRSKGLKRTPIRCVETGEIFKNMV